jgi:hypothetical protein
MKKREYIITYDAHGKYIPVSSPKLTYFHADFSPPHACVAAGFQTFQFLSVKGIMYNYNLGKIDYIAYGYRVETQSHNFRFIIFI